MMVVYTSCLLPVRQFLSLFLDASMMPGQQVQKYHRLLVKGFIKNNCEVCVISAPPVSRYSFKRLFLRGSVCEEKEVQYYCLPVFNIPGIKQMITFFCASYQQLLLCLQKSDLIVICDILNLSVSMGAIIVARIFRKKVVGIVTDLPEMIFGKHRGFGVIVSNMLIGMCTNYVFLTEQMNAKLNKMGKPFTVIEGHVDVEMGSIANKLSEKSDIKVVLYAGFLSEVNGVQMLVDGFLKANCLNTELHLYGDGNMAAKLHEICELHSTIKYFGVIPNEDVVQAELRATLLVNPRFSNEEYTKYSFPSKNLEYMASGTPVLTTRLPGMPEEYDEYVYIIEEETTDGFAEMLWNVIMKPISELHLKGKKAKAFVLKEKNNYIAANKILEMLEDRGSNKAI